MIRARTAESIIAALLILLVALIVMVTAGTASAEAASRRRGAGCSAHRLPLQDPEPRIGDSGGLSARTDRE